MLERYGQDSGRTPAAPSVTHPTQAAPPPLTPPSDAVLCSLAEQERKRLQVIRTPTVRRFEEQDQGLVQFGRVEKIEGLSYALVHRQELTLVIPVDDATYGRLASSKQGHSLRVSSTGTPTLGTGRRR